MKKILFAAVALVAMASCATEDVVSLPDNNVAIGFDTFVENSTRANDINASNLADFGVYGSVVNKDGQQGMIFGNTKVSNDNGTFTYSPAQYWIAGAKYDFVAIAPFEDANWTYAPNGVDAANGTISFDNAAAGANQDLLFAEATKTTATELTADPGVVGFTFNHMLSRVKFTFTNGFQSNGNIELAISNVHITNAAANGTLAVADRVAAAEWTAENFNLDVDFDNVAEGANGNATQLAENGSGSTEHFYLIPAETTYNITFDVTLYQAGVLVDTYARTATLTVDLNRGMSYNVKTTLDQTNTSDEGEIYPIVFDVVAVEDWDEFEDVEATVPEHTVANASELAQAVAEGGAIVLTQDINLDTATTRASAYGLFIQKDCVIDGAGHTITCDLGYDVRAIAVSGAENVVLKNFTLAATGERGIQVQGGAKNVTIENVTATAANYTVNLPSSAGATNVVINNCDLKGLNTINVAAPGAVVTVNDSTLRTEDNASTEGYATIAINKDGIGANVTVNGGEVVITGSYATDTEAGSVGAEGANIVFNGTKCGEGEPTIKDRYFAIVYPDGNYYAFSTLADAVAKAEEGETIILTKDATVAAETKIYKNVNIDLNGFTLTAAAIDPIENYGKMTISNGKIVAGNAEETRRCIYNYGEMTINGVEFVQTYDKKGAAINNEGKMIINDAKVDAVRYAVWSSGVNAETIINSGTFSNETDMNLPVYAVVAYEGAKMTINGGTFISDHGCVCACDGSQVLINGGTFTCTSEYSAGSDWVFAGGDGSNAMNNDGSLIKYDESECVINGNILNNGCVVAF